MSKLAGLPLGQMVQTAARRNPTLPIVVDRPLDIRPDLGLDFTLADFAGAVEKFAGQLSAAGVKDKQRVAVYKTHNADILVIACALARIGAVPALLSPGLTGAVATDLIARLKPDHVLTDGAKVSLGHVVPGALATSSVLLAAGDHAGLVTVSTLEGRPAPLPAPADPARPIIITHTSGTTGEPKLVEQSARGLNAHTVLQLRIAKVMRVHERFAMCVSFVHARTYSALALGLARSMPFAFISDHDADNVREVFLKFRPGLVETHPNTFVQWEHFVDDPARPLGSTRFYISTFDAIHPRTVRKLLAASDRRMPVYFQAYGQTETGPVTVRPYTRFLAKIANGRCVGYSIPGLTKVRLRNGRKRPSLIEVRSKGRGLTYIGQGSRFTAQLDGGWWSMGDIGYAGRWGCVHLLDREIDQAEGLESILALEDVVMNRLEQLTEVVLVPTEGGEVRPVVCTRRDKPLDLAAWRAAVAGLPPMEEPLHCRWEDIPQTTTFKVKRGELRRAVEERSLRPLGQVA